LLGVVSAVSFSLFQDYRMLPRASLTPREHGKAGDGRCVRTRRAAPIRESFEPLNPSRILPHHFDGYRNDEARLRPESVNNLSKLTGKVAVVTGASKGIGAAIAKQLAADGANVVVNYATSREGADKVVGEITKAGGKAIAVGASVAKEADIEALFTATKKAYGKVDILVNNAGVYGFSPLEQVTPEEYKRQFDTNVLGLLLTTKTALPHFPAEGGSVINISSIVSTLAPPAASIYASTKGAVDTITKSLAKELAPRKIRVNAINPGLVITEGTQSAGIVDSDFEKQAIAATPLGRAGRPEDIAPPVSFLASDDARWITGETIFVSGGYAI
jgi:3-oxoacyl-[acyl-carrier protein] reductase